MLLYQGMQTMSKENAEAMRIMKGMACARYDYIRFTFVDFHGITRSKTVPKARIKEIFVEGCSFFAGAIGMSLVGPMVSRDQPDIKNTNSGNVFARPQPGTLHTLPLNGGPCRMGEVLCETFFPNGTPQSANPRAMARKQLHALKRRGYDILSSWELEVTFVNSNNLEPNFNKSIMAFSNKVYDEMEELLLMSEKAFSEMGIDLETLQAEASPGQYEFVTKPIKGIRQADNLIVMKDTLRQVARRFHKKAVFMTKMFPQAGYSAALHFNHSVWDLHNRNQFWDYSDENRLSKTCRQWVAGLLKHAGALTALTCPTVNCYRRLHTSIAPTQADWGFDARLACCRLKNYRPDSTYCELRLPSGSGNPYIIMAATIAAGIDGLEKKYDLPAAIGQYDLEKLSRSSDVPTKAGNVDTKGDMESTEPALKKAKLEDGDSAENSPKVESDDKASGDHDIENNSESADEVLEKDSDEVKNESNSSEGEKPEEVTSFGEIPHTLEEALQALEADKVIIEALGPNFVEWFVEIKRNEIKHFEGFKDLTEDEMLMKERECYMDVL